jgi:hypothetical protein
MHQLSFISESSDVPIARASDPVTSKSAESEITNNGVRSQNTHEALVIVQAIPGICGSEMEERHRKRLRELERDGLIKRGEPRVAASGYLGVTWWPVE